MWRPVLHRLDVVPHAIVTCRSAWEVAASLARRNGFSVEKSLLLWMDHVLSAERSTRDLHRAFVGYESLLREPVATLQEAGRRLELAWPLVPADRPEELSEFLDPGLHHISVSESIDGIVAGSTYGLVHDLSETVDRARRGAVDASAFDELGARYRELAARIDPLIVEHLHQFGRREVEARLWSARLALQHQIDSASTRLGAGLSDLETGLTETKQEITDLAAQLQRVSDGLESRDRVESDRRRDADRTLRHLSEALAAAERGIEHLGQGVETARTSITRWQTDVPLELGLLQAQRGVADLKRRVERLEKRRGWLRRLWRRIKARASA
jgi:hypothetical protein